MSTQPRISAPIGRLRMKTSGGSKRRGSGVGRWTPAEPPTEASASEADTELSDSTHPPFYPFPLRATEDDIG